MKDFLEWWNAIYWIPLGLSLLWILLVAVSGHGHFHLPHLPHLHLPTLHGHLELGHDIPHGALAGHDAHGVDSAATHEAIHGHAAASPHPAASQQDWSDKLMGLLGLGAGPITLIVGLYMLFWGTFGLLVNSICRDAGMLPAVYILPSLAATFVATTIVTRLSAGILGKYMPTTESFAISVADLIGREGLVIHLVTEKAGTVDVTDAYGTVHRRTARTEPGAAEITPNTKILVVDLDEEDNRLIVKQYGDPATVP